jgi:O-acetyl-ADP-ribose deacetylase (regulator of RNase III)
VYGYPLEEAAAIAVGEMRSLDATTVEAISLVAFDAAVLEALTRALKG